MTLWMASLAESGYAIPSRRQALCAMAFTFKRVLRVDMGNLELPQLPRETKRIKIIPDREELGVLFAAMRGPSRLMAGVMYGAGLRVEETCHLRVHDIDGEVVNLFRVLREQHEELAARCSMTPFSRKDFSEAFEDVECPALDRAWKTLVRSHMGFAGAGTLFRKTGFRSFSVNSGSHPAKQWALFPEHIACIGERLRGVVIEHADACDVMVQQDTPETLHYVDPPYMAETRDKGADYRHELDDDAHRKLAAVLRRLRGKVIVSGYPSDAYEEDFNGWRRVEREAQAERAKLRTEVLWMNYDAPVADLFGIPERRTHVTPGLAL